MVVPISQIYVSTPNRFDLGNLKSLADNMAAFGMLHPLLVAEIKERKDEGTIGRQDETASAHPSAAVILSSFDSYRYELIAGYRRLKAAEFLGWTEVPVSVISPADELKQFDTSLHENFRRKDLNPLEICDIILERKSRWEKLYGPIKRGPKSSDNPTEVEFYGNSVKFNNETSRILRMGESSINRFLQLKDLDQDLKQLVEERKISYRDAIEQQSSRKKEQKQSKSKKMGLSILPDKETAIALQTEYNRSPVFFQTMMLVGHMYQSINRFQGKQPEFESANPDRIVMMIGHLSAISSWVNTLMKQAEETLMQQTGTQIPAET